jgi:hypothetical protein
MKRFLLTLALAAASVLAVGAPGSAHAQYGYYGNFRGGGQNWGNAHVRSLSPPGYIYQQSYAPTYGYGGGYGGGYGHHHHHGHGYGPNCGYRSNGYAPYGGYGGGYSAGSITIRW